MAENEDFARADRLGRTRARMLPALAAMLIAQQAAFIAGRWERPPRTVDTVNVGAWLILSAVLLLLLTTGGAWIQSKQVRALLNDEVTRAHRLDALRLGFIVTMVTAMALYLLSYLEAVDGREAIHLLVSGGLVAALLRFGFLERRALKDG